MRLVLSSSLLILGALPLVAAAPNPSPQGASGSLDVSTTSLQAADSTAPIPTATSHSAVAAGSPSVRPTSIKSESSSRLIVIGSLSPIATTSTISTLTSEPSSLTVTTDVLSSASASASASVTSAEAISNSVWAKAYNWSSYAAPSNVTVPDFPDNQLWKTPTPKCGDGAPLPAGHSRPYLEDLDHCPYPDRSLFPVTAPLMAGSRIVQTMSIPLWAHMRMDEWLAEVFRLCPGVTNVQDDLGRSVGFARALGRLMFGRDGDSAEMTVSDQRPARIFPLHRVLVC